MSSRSTPPFRADHVGSLLRPRALLDAREEHAAGRLSDDDLAVAEDAAITDVVDLQREAGLQTVTDGEFRRTSWHMDFIYQLEGVHRTEEQLEVHFHNAGGDLDFTSAGLVVDGPVRIDQPIFGEAFDFLASVAPEDMTPKLTIPSPSMVQKAMSPTPSRAGGGRANMVEPSVAWEAVAARSSTR